ncbi:MAG: NADH:ubiquinone reductase (Na(+)-transporting) subunit E [Deltaproteobacteria bacterium]|nr:NADH:ubiquinone reductase (Na(+)-transporting) subunit E [Deltaproteobacteria bacterium]MBW2696848.1 NADH:ubiquinone reductase (Na(+)-transporting) subunit E [Deltaproteobacteria bacterium]
MEGLIDIVVKAVFIENLALAYMLGMCTFLAVSTSVRTAIGVGAAVVVVQTITVPLNHILYVGLLKQGNTFLPPASELDISFLGLIVYIGVIASVVQILEMVLDRFFPALFTAMGIYLPLLTVNCAILGGSLFMVDRGYSLAESTAYGFGTGAGFALAIVALAGLRARMAYSDPPSGLRGAGMAFLITGLISLAFMGFTGVSL